MAYVAKPTRLTVSEAEHVMTIESLKTARSFLRPALSVAALALVSVVAGCQSPSQILASERDVAMQAAVRRGQFELSCPTATGTVLSSNILQPALYGGFEHAEYTIGVSG